MSFQIRQIVLYSHDGQSREVNLRVGGVSVITGESHTGKSALAAIVDYCLGARTCGMPVGIIRDRVAWCAVRLASAGGEAFIARRVPAAGVNSSEDFYVDMAYGGELPAHSQLRQTANRDACLGLLAGFAGIGANRNEPPAGQTRPPLTATIRHALSYAFQPQDVITSRRFLFHNQGEPFEAQAIKDTLPYFLGAVGDDFVEKTERLRRVRQLLREMDRRLAAAQRIAGGGLGQANELLSEARALGLLGAGARASEFSEATRLLREASDAPVELALEGMAPGRVAEEYERLLTERETVKEQVARATDELLQAKGLAGDGDGYAAEVQEHVARLECIGVVPADGGGSGCPLCGTDLAGRVTAASEVTSALRAMRQQLDMATRRGPELQAVIAELQGRADAGRARLGEIRSSLEALRAQNERLSRMREEATRRAHYLGRLSMYLDAAPEVAEDSGLQRQRAELEREASQLESELDAQEIFERVGAMLSRMGQRMAEWARTLRLEHSADTIRLDLGKLMVVADTEDGAVTLAQMGAGENWMGLHVITHLALHEFFLRRNRPVPRFLFLDQPFQVYFPRDADLGDAGEARPTGDLAAAGRFFEFVAAVVAELAPGLQVVITEHADLDTGAYAQSVVERWWGGVKLVPETWSGR